MRDEADRVYAYSEMWNIQGFLDGDTQAAITTACNSLIDAFAVDGRDLTLLDNQGAAARTLRTALSLGGTRVVRPPSFPEGGLTKAEYAPGGWRTFDLAVEAEYHLTGIAVIAFDETITFSGGGPEIAHLRTTRGPPQKQILNEQIEYRAVQKGTATGHVTYPTAPPPIWPGALKETPELIAHTPKRKGNSYHSYMIEWSYTFESATRLSGRPTLWRG